MGVCPARFQHWESVWWMETDRDSSQRPLHLQVKVHRRRVITSKLVGMKLSRYLKGAKNLNGNVSAIQAT